MDESELWLEPFATPMVERAFAWAAELVNTGHTGGIIYAPTRTGKSKLCELLTEELREFSGRRGKSIRSATLFITTWDRRVMSEGGFWRWILKEVKHACAEKKRLEIWEARHLVYEFFKGAAGAAESGRLILIIDEAQVLDLVELGWLADVFNDMCKHRLQLIVLLIGSYHLQQWKKDLERKKHEHVRSRFFTKEHGLTGLRELQDFRRCLLRFDIDKTPLNGEGSIANYYQPEWVSKGGLLEGYATTFIDAFRQLSQNPTQLNVPMAYFARALRILLDTDEFSLSPDAVAAAVSDSGFTTHLDADLVNTG